MTNLDTSVVDFLRNVVEALEATGNPLQHVYGHTSCDVTCCSWLLG